MGTNKTVPIALTEREAKAVLGLLMRWHGIEPARDRAERKIELGLQVIEDRNKKKIPRCNHPNMIKTMYQGSQEYMRCPDCGFEGWD